MRDAHQPPVLAPNNSSLRLADGCLPGEAPERHVASLAHGGSPAHLRGKVQLDSQRGMVGVPPIGLRGIGGEKTRAKICARHTP